MLLLAAWLLTTGVVDLVRWGPEPARPARAATALAAGLAAALALAALAGAGGARGALVVAAGALPAAAWVGADAARLRARGAGPLAALAAAAVAVTAAAPAAPPVGGALARWWSALGGAGLGALGGVPAGQALTALAALIACWSSANRVVRAVLSRAGTPPGAGEAALRGGRLLGPLERTFILALALGGDLTAAAVVIAAKGVLRLPEIRTARAQRRGGPDVVTEYFLVGTFTSWLLAVAAAALVVAAGR